MRTIFTIVALIFTLSLSAQIGESSGEKEQKTLGGIVTLLNGYETNGSAQISINETTDDNGNPYYMLSFQNQEYTTLTDTQIAGFFASSEDLDYLFGEMKKVFKTKETTSIPLGRSNMRISYMELSKSLFIQMRGQAKGNFKLNVRQFYNLFGRGSELSKKSWKAYLKS